MCSVAILIHAHGESTERCSPVFFASLGRSLAVFMGGSPAGEAGPWSVAGASPGPTTFREKGGGGPVVSMAGASPGPTPFPIRAGTLGCVLR